MIETMRDESFLSLNTDKLFDIIKSLIQHFESLLISDIQQKSEQVLQTMLYQAYEVKTIDAYKKTVWCFGLDENSNEYMMFKDKKNKKSKYLKKFTMMSSINNSSGNSANINKTSSNDEVLNSSRSILSDAGGTIDTTTNNNVFQPIKYLFSAAVPALLREVYVLVVKYFLYVTKIKNLYAHGEPVCNCFQTIYETIAESMITTLRSEDVRDTTIAKASQIAIDASTLSSSSNSLWVMLEAALIHFRWSESLNMHIPKTILASKVCYCY